MIKHRTSLPKTIHTATVVVNLARHMRNSGMYPNTPDTPEGYARLALSIISSTQWANDDETFQACVKQLAKVWA
jgi:hypothetical protein